LREADLPSEELDCQFLLKLAGLRVVETKTKCDQSNPRRAADALVARVKEHASLPYAIKACQKFASAVKSMWVAADPKECDSPYEWFLERYAFQIVLCRQHIHPRKSGRSQKSD